MSHCACQKLVSVIWLSVGFLYTIHVDYLFFLLDSSDSRTKMAQGGLVNIPLADQLDEGFILTNKSSVIL